MKFTLPTPIDGYEAESEYRIAAHGDWVLSASGGAHQSIGAITHPRLVLTPIKPAVPPELKARRIEIELDGDEQVVYTPNGLERSVYPLICDTRCHGFIYRHPNGHERTFGCCHPIFVIPDSGLILWGAMQAKQKLYTLLLRPCAVLWEGE